MNENDFIKKLKESAEDITPPDALSPEAIEQKLRGAQTPGTARRRKIFRLTARAGSAAAVFAAAFLAWNQTNRIAQKTSENDAVSLEETSREIPDAAAENSAENAGEAVLADTASAASGAETPVEELSYASDYDSIYEALKEAFWDESDELESLMMGYGGYDTGVVTSSDADIVYDAEVAEVKGSSGSSDYSSTNVQEAGVDEGDTVKTDGRYLYILKAGGGFSIVDAAQADSLELLCTVSPESDSSDITANAMYLDGDTLQILTTEYVTALVQAASSGEDETTAQGGTESQPHSSADDTASESDSAAAEAGSGTADTESSDEGDSTVYYRESHYETVLYTYDISDHSNPALTGRVSQDGEYSDSRRVGDYVYLFSAWTPTIASTREESDITPFLNGEQAAASDYYLPENLNYRDFLVISSVSCSQPSALSDSKILVSGAGDFYVSQENIYILTENYAHDNTVTEITKFHYADGTITGTAAGSVTGYLNDTFSLNEYEGNLRLVVTYYGSSLSSSAEVMDWTEHNALYILDEALAQRSVISDLAPDETIRSARFLGETGYFVTFRQTDPLFSVDLSDPDNPQILGELKISGFSSYLHFYGENLLLGLGYEADESTGAASGLKLSMFDISDPSNVTETGRYVISGVTWCESLEYYKSILADSLKNLIGFYCDNRYLLFSWDEETGFQQKMAYDFYSDNLTGQADSQTTRGVYLGDTFCIAGESFVLSFDMTDGFAKRQTLLLS